MNKMKYLSKLASWSGIIGATLVALNVGIGVYGYAIFLVSSLSWIYYSVNTKQMDLFQMNIVFAAINLVGLFRHF